MPATVTEFPKSITPRGEQNLLFSIVNRLGDGGGDLVQRMPSSVVPRGQQDLLYSILLGIDTLMGSVGGGGAVDGALVLKGSIDCSANPNYPAATAGDVYVVSVAGKIGGASGATVEAGDQIIATADNAGGTQAGVGSSWTISQANVAFTAAGTAMATAASVAAQLQLLGSGSAATGSGAVVLASSPTLITPNIDTPSSGVLTNCTGLPVSTGISGLGSGVATWLSTPSLANLNSALATTLLTSGGALGTPSSGTLTNCTGLPASGVVGTAAVLTGNAFTGANSVTLTGLGTSVTAGLSLINSTAAAAGAQQYSPAWILGGYGWKTNSTAASQQVLWQSYVIPIQGAANPTSSLNFESNVNGGSYGSAVRFVYRDDGWGQIQLGSSSNPCGLIGAGGGGLYVQAYGTNVLFTNSIDIQILGVPIGFGPNASANNADLFLTRYAAASFQLGKLHATTPTTQTIKAHDVTTGTGADLCLANGRGSAAGGAVKLAVSATTGSPTVIVTVKASGVVNIANLPTSSSGLSTGDLYTMAGALMVA